jgi:hypothetical protein
MSNQSEFLTFERFINREDAESLKEFLIAYAIPAQISDNRSTFDVTFANNHVDATFHVEIPADRFESAALLLERVYEEDVDHLPDDYYLFSFSDEELLGVLRESDQWNKLDVGLSKILLRKRGHQIDDETFSSFKQQRIEELSIAEQADRNLIIVGYLCSFLILVVNYIALGLGLSIGVSLYFRYKILPNGKKVAYYNASSRKNAMAIIVLNLVFWAIALSFSSLHQVLEQFL